MLGVLGATPAHYGWERAGGVQAVTIQVGWDYAEPTAGALSPSYVSGIADQILQAQQAGLRVVIDPGLQYPPSWVIAMPGSQFVNQYGDTFTGQEASGENVVNGVTDQQVRAAESQYLSLLGSQLSGLGLLAVRVGGGPLGELRYPDATYMGHTNSFWAYDPSTQSSLPGSVQGWVPGTGTSTQATTFLNAYDQDLDQYGQWLNGQLHADFGVMQLLLLPGWGQRPGGAAGEAAALLQPARPADDPTKFDEFNQGLDWGGLLADLPYPAEAVAYTTYLSARSVLPTPQLEDPADYLASLVSGTPIRLGGENSGNNSLADLQYCAAQAKALGFVIVQWMGEGQLLATTAGTDPTGPSLAQLGALLGDSSTSTTTTTQPASPTQVAPLSLAGVSAPTATTNRLYSLQLSASGGATPYNWKLASGELPTGLALDSGSGRITGVPTVAGSFPVTVQVSDGVGTSSRATFAFEVTNGDAPPSLMQPVTAIASSGDGYWVADSLGDVAPLGDAPYEGSLAGLPAHAPVRALVPTPSGRGYWMVASDGGVFTFGDAAFDGSAGSIHLNAPIVGMAPTADGNGYWLVASDGGIFSFGDAVLLRVDRRAPAQRADRRHGRDARRPRLLARGVRRRHLLLRARVLLRVDRRAPAQRADRRHGRDARRPRLLARGVRRRHLRVRQRRLPRVDRRAPAQCADRRHDRNRRWWRLLARRRRRRGLRRGHTILGHALGVRAG